MCFSAIHWAGMERIVFAASIADAQAAGFNELTISNVEMKKMGVSKLEIVGGYMQQEGVQLFKEFVAKGGVIY
jgi:guanine deaminase